MEGDALPRATDGGPERAVLVGLSADADGGGTLEELTRLAQTAGASVVGIVAQRRARANPATFVGRGKVEEVLARARETGADLVIVDGELSPAQQRNLERSLHTKVLDRTALVLDIFAQRARTSEGRLQVELAQMTYLLPRLAGRGGILSRLGGGIGTRGPGETKLEVDRRRIRSRITGLERQIESLRQHRRLQRQVRTEAALPVVALIGYTNAGKSSLLNTLTRADVMTADKLFATLDPTVRKAVLPNRRPVLFVDTVGFIQKLPHDLVAAFRATLEEVVEADLLVHVIDGSHPRWSEQMAAVEDVLVELGAAETLRINAINKIDRITREALRDIEAEVPGAIPISALRRLGLVNLLRTIAQRLPDPIRRVSLVIPYTEAGVLAKIYAEGRVLRREDRDDGTLVEAEVPPRTLERLRPYLREPGTA
ncbi:MAG: GTPase HflX [Bacillati bacterium ANGP1]|uniref:GTPase HflX n=1 Tax=Candidatus Segetimicrobium genomatis TaxID=2569760 RepID=A0A537K271_9BACT|nr:MAG: GTPase HflX [Terrabacteria group bacterium ANGP1]